MSVFDIAMNWLAVVGTLAVLLFIGLGLLAWRQRHVDRGAVLREREDRR